MTAFPRSTLTPLLLLGALITAVPALAQQVAPPAATTPPATAAPQLTPAIPGMVAAGTPVQLIREGFQGTEGPVTLHDGSLIFTETQASRITRIAADGSISTFLDNSNGSNGLGFNARGELISVQTVRPLVGVVHPPAGVRVLAAEYQGQPFGRPNDLVVSSKGGVYFTDPGVAPQAGQPPQPKPAVYFLSPQGKLTRLAIELARPNGIQLSPDEKLLYVANTLGEHVLAYDIAADGTVSGERRFARLSGWTRSDSGVSSSGADGLAVDAQGRLYVASNAGIEVFAASGDALGVIPLPKKPQNLAFAGPDKRTLYVVGRGAAYRIAVQTPGFGGRAK